MQKSKKKFFQPDEELIGRCIKKDKAAFKQLVEMYQQYAYNLAFKILLNEDDAKDIVQETFIRIWNHIGNYKKDVLFTTWLYKIVTNLCYDKLKAMQRRNHVPLNMAENSGYVLSDVNGQSLQHTENNDLMKHIRKLSRGLTTKQRMVFVLRDLQDLPIRVVGEILNMSEGAVKTNLYLARMCIREKLIVSEKSGGLTL